MPTYQLLILILVIVVALLLVWLLVRRSSSKKDLARAEAAEVRVEAEQVAATMAGLETYAAQSQERADLARAQAEQAARQADRLIVEADQDRTEVEVTRRDYEAMLARADEVDPDVRTPAETEQPAEIRSPAEAADDATLRTRAEARQQREETERAAWASSPAAPIPGAAGAAVMGADAWADRSVEDRDEAAAVTPAQQPPEDAAAGAAESARSGADDARAGAPGDERSARIAAATDYRDEPDVDGDAATGPEPVAEDGTIGPDGDADDPATDARTPTNEWGGPHEDSVADESEPAEDEAPAADDETPAARDGDDVSGEADGDRVDPAPERDWAADEGALLAENEERAERLAEDRADMEREAAAAGLGTSHEDEPEPVAEPEPEPEREPGLGHEPEVEPESEPEPDAHVEEPAAPAEPRRARRVSEFHEIRDGGFGMGSAAPIEDGAQPLDHPVQAYRDTMTYRVPGDPGYDDAGADVWFYDVGAAERSGFRRSEG